VVSEILDAERVRSILATVPDPELPVVSITDLGMVHRVRSMPRPSGHDPPDVRQVPGHRPHPGVDRRFLAGYGRPVVVDTSYERRGHPTGSPTQPGGAHGRRDRATGRSDDIRCRSARRRGSPWTACSGRASVGRCTTAATAGSRSGDEAGVTAIGVIEAGTMGGGSPWSR
jgi:hypothetical protein